MWCDIESMQELPLHSYVQRKQACMAERTETSREAQAVMYKENKHAWLKGLKLQGKHKQNDHSHFCNGQIRFTQDP